MTGKVCKWKPEGLYSARVNLICNMRFYCMWNSVIVLAMIHINLVEILLNVASVRTEEKSNRAATALELEEMFGISTLMAETRVKDLNMVGTCIKHDQHDFDYCSLVEEWKELLSDDQLYLFEYLFGSSIYQSEFIDSGLLTELRRVICNSDYAPYQTKMQRLLMWQLGERDKPELWV